MRARGLVAPAVGLAAMVATPLLELGRRRVATNVVVLGLAATTLERVRRAHGSGRATAAASAVVGLGWFAERCGTATGRLFGAYEYTGRLRPAVGGVPAAVPVAWFAMAVPARAAAHAALGRRSTPGSRVVLGAAALTAWDLFLDPQMVAEGYWRWRRPGRYRGIPATNFVGWLLVSSAAMALLELTAPLDDDDLADPVLVAEYAVVAAMETLGFAAFFRDRLVAAVGGAAMLPIAGAAVTSLIRGGGRADRRP